MSWLQKRPDVSDPTMFYSVGLNKTILLVGLGNPGKDYDLTRHNAGWLAIDNFVSKTDGMEEWIQKKDFKCLLSSGRAGDARVIAIKPTTFMNLSGEAVQAVMAFYKIPLDKVVVIHDELDIDFGQIRMRMGGSSAGHNGIKSVTQHLGEDYGRIRIGVGPKPEKIDSEAFVLQKFSAEEQAQLSNLTQEVNSILSEYIYGTELPHETRSFLV
ncbi:aminoacyl-tRNA hydrolase [Candidatus Saccharibacteria bacterium CG_4_10_14_0_2_um_filter_52_9]|nr:MAG: aminoacyl-tRNA hydrolase [Candidatus Saccharibacteria bacterium CG_4_10_14_0_2_um_filter_52_9]